MSIQHFYRYTCDVCGKQVTIDDDRDDPEGWATIWMYVGQDEGGTTVHHVCPECLNKTGQELVCALRESYEAE